MSARGSGRSPKTGDVSIKRLAGMTHSDVLFREALDQALAGRGADSIATLESLLRVMPQHVEGMRLMGKLLLRARRSNEALAILKQAAALTPHHPELAYEVGVAALECGAIVEAVEWFSRQLADRPDLQDARFNLAWALRRLGKTAEAVAAYRTLVEQAPGHGHAWYNLANGLLALGRLAEAGDAYRMALTHLGPRPDVVANTVLLLLRQGQWPEAHAVLARVPEAGKTVELRSLEGELLMSEGRLSDALDRFLRLSVDHPDHQPSLLGLARCLCEMGRVIEAAAWLDGALRKVPNDPKLNLLRSEVALKDDDMATAIRTARLAVDSQGSTESYAALGKALALSGCTGEAAKVFRTGLQRHPDCYALHSNLLFCLLHDAATSPEDVFIEHQAFGRFWESRFPTPAFLPPDQTELAGRRLRIGYVSPDLCDHAVTFFFEPLLDGHDRTQFEIFCYHIPRKTDAVTARLRGKADHWRILAFEDIAGAIETIRHDRIDILVDIAGHTAWNLLPVFAAKPAPVQISCLGYPGTTGLTRIDYRLVSRSGAKNSDEPRFSTEAVALLILPFAAPATLPQVSPPPFLRGKRMIPASYNDDTLPVSGRDGGPARPCARPASEGSLDESPSRLDGMIPASYNDDTLPVSGRSRGPASEGRLDDSTSRLEGMITFGSVSRLVKVSVPAQRAWIRILEALPDARLLLVAPGVEREHTAQKRLEQLAALGFPPERLDLRPECQFEAWLEYLTEIDIVLDPFPYTAGTTATLLQWMGLPLIRLGVAACPELGLYAAASEDDYVATAVALAKNRPALFQLRTILRANSMVFQQDRNASAVPALEAFYRQAWRERVCG